MRIFLLAFFTIIISFQSKGQEVWSIEKCIDQALSNNVDVALQDINVDYAELGVKQAKHDFGPNINGTFNYINYFGRALDQTSNSFNNNQSVLINNSYNLVGNLDLFNGLQRMNTLKKSKLLVESSLLTKKISEEAIQLQLLTTFLSILMSKEQLSQSINQNKNTTQERERVSDLIDDGLLAKNDIYILDAQLANDQIAITNFKNNIKLGLSDLKQVMRLDLGKEIDIEVPELPESLEELGGIESIDAIYQEALTHRSEIKSVALNETIGDYDEKIAKGKYYPTVSLFGGSNTSFSNAKIPETTVSGVTLDPFNIETETIFNRPNKYFKQFSDNLAYNLGLTVNIPIFNKNLVRLNVQQTKVAHKQNILLSEKTKLDLFNAITRAHNNAVAAMENYNAAEANEKAAKQSLESAKAKLEDGLGSRVEFNVASNNYSIATSRLIEAKYNYIFNIKYLDFYKGIPIKL